MRLVLIKNTEYNYISVWEDGITPPDGSIRVSESIDVDFEMLPQSDLVNAEVDALKEMVVETLANAQIKVNAIEDKIQSLLAITN